MKELSIYSNLSHNYLSCFFPVGFSGVENGSVAHLTEHYLFYMMKKYLIKENKKLGFYCNAFTTENYSGFWFGSKKNDFNLFKERFRLFLNEIKYMPEKVDEVVIRHEKRKIKSELEKIRKEIDEGKRKNFVSQDLIEYDTVRKCTGGDVAFFLKRYLECAPFVISYGPLEEKAVSGVIYPENTVLNSDDIFLDNNMICVKYVSLYIRILMQTVVSFLNQNLFNSCYLIEDTQYLKIIREEKYKVEDLKRALEKIEKLSQQDFYIYLDYIGKKTSEKYCAKAVSYLAEVYCCYSGTGQLALVSDLTDMLYSITFEEFTETIKRIRSVLNE